MVKNIVILGAGFAGIRVVQDLQKDLPNSYRIVLVDKESTHLFRADLYEVATAFSKKINKECLTKLKDTIAIPIKSLINQKRVCFIQDAVSKIDPVKREVSLKKNKKLSYEYLVVAMGSETNYFGIDGLEKNAFGLKTIQDALKINCHLDQFFQDLWRRKLKKEVYITVGGGGASGVETVTELVGAVRSLCEKYHYPNGKVTLQLIEGSAVLGGFGGAGTKVILERCEKFGIKVYLNNFIQKADKKEIVLKNKTGKLIKIKSDILIWTGGVKVNAMVQKCFGQKECGGAILVNEFMLAKNFSKVFAAGDNAYFADPENPAKRLPMLANVALDQGKVIAQNILSLINKGDLQKFTAKRGRFMLPLGAKYAICEDSDGRIRKGFSVWLSRKFVFLRYAMSILPFFKALRKWWHSSRIFMEND
ncbi:MAG: FAD-dependent oxidoreductase [Patescibacteria group bacterium]